MNLLQRNDEAMKFLPAPNLDVEKRDRNNCETMPVWHVCSREKCCLSQRSTRVKMCLTLSSTLKSLMQLRNMVRTESEYDKSAVTSCVPLYVCEIRDVCSRMKRYQVFLVCDILKV